MAGGMTKKGPLMTPFVAPFAQGNGKPKDGTSDRLDISSSYKHGDGHVIPDPTGKILIPNTKTKFR